MFKGCSSLSSIYFGIGVKSIGASACENCSSLTRIHLSETVREIHSNAFKNCPLTSVKLPNSINRINYGAFEGCALTEIEIPASMDNAYGLDDRVFANNTDLEKVTINCFLEKFNDVTGTGRHQFEGCDNIKYISVKTHAIYPALYQLFSSTDINQLQELVFLPGTTDVPVGNSSPMPNLTNLVLPEGLKTIWGANFNSCDHLKTLILPSTLEKIEMSSFKNCQFAGIVSMAENAPILGSEVFLNVSPYTPVAVPDKSEYADKPIWENFFALYSSNEHTSTVLASNEVYVETTAHSASVSYPAVEEGKTTSITIVSQSTGEEYTYYNMDSPVSEAYMPRKLNYVRTEDNETIDGYMFTIPGLAANTTYDYTVTTYNANEEVLAEYTGTFTTLEDEHTSIDQITNDQITNDQSQITNKFLRDGQIFILRGDKTYTLTGQEVK